MKKLLKALLIISAITITGLSFTACATTQPATSTSELQVNQIPSKPEMSEVEKAYRVQ